MKKQYINPEMLIEYFGNAIECNGFGFDSFEGLDRFIDEEEEM